MIEPIEPVTEAPHALEGLGRQGAWNSLSVAAQTLANLGLAFVGIRVLGVAGFGVLSTLLVVLSVLMVVEFAIAAGIVRAVAAQASAGAERTQLREYATSAHRMLLGVGVALAGIALVVASVIRATGLQAAGLTVGTLAVSVAIMGVSAAVFIGGAGFAAVVTGCRSFRVLAVTSALGVAVGAVVLALVAERWGLVGIAIAHLSMTSVQRGLQAGWVRRHVRWFGLVPRRARTRSNRPVWAYSLPLLIMSVGSNLVSLGDVVIIGSFIGAAALGAFRIGVAIPSQLLALIYRASDVSFPALAGSGSAGEQIDTAAVASRLVSFGAGLLFGVLYGGAAAVILAFAGSVEPVTRQTLEVAVLAWLVNVPSHVGVLVLLARSAHGPLAWLVAAEVAVNVVLTAVLVSTMGVVGAAWATLVTMAAASLVGVPFIARRSLARPFRLVYLDGLLPAVAGFVLSVAVTLAVMGGGDDLGRLVAASTAVLLVGTTAGLVVVGRSGRNTIRTMFGRDQPRGIEP